MSDQLGQQLWLKCINAFCDYDEVQQLVDQGADLNWRNEARVPSSILGFDGRIGIGWTPLMNAAVRGNVEVIRLLLDHGADIQKKDADGRTALHNATYHDYDEAASLLVKRGAYLHVKDSRGYTPIDITNYRISPVYTIIQTVIDYTKGKDD